MLDMIYQMYDKGIDVETIAKDVIRRSKSKGVNLTTKSARVFVETVIVSRQRKLKRERSYFYD